MRWFPGYAILNDQALPNRVDRWGIGQYSGESVRPLLPLSTTPSRFGERAAWPQPTALQGSEERCEGRGPGPAGFQGRGQPFRTEDAEPEAFEAAALVSMSKGEPYVRSG